MKFIVVLLLVVVASVAQAKTDSMEADTGFESWDVRALSRVRGAARGRARGSIFVIPYLTKADMMNYAKLHYKVIKSVIGTLRMISAKSKTMSMASQPTGTYKAAILRHGAAMVRRMNYINVIKGRSETVLIRAYIAGFGRDKPCAGISGGTTQKGVNCLNRNLKRLTRTKMNAVNLRRIKVESKFVEKCNNLRKYGVKYGAKTPVYPALFRALHKDLDCAVAHFGAYHSFVTTLIKRQKGMTFSKLRWGLVLKHSVLNWLAGRTYYALMSYMVVMKPLVPKGGPKVKSRSLGDNFNTAGLDISANGEMKANSALADRITRTEGTDEEAGVDVDGLDSADTDANEDEADRITRTEGADEEAGVDVDGLDSADVDVDGLDSADTDANEADRTTRTEGADEEAGVDVDGLDSADADANEDETVERLERLLKHVISKEE